MLPVIALVGRPNVGKSTLFNRLTRTRDALVADIPGLTRDRKYGDGVIGPRPYIVVDTGGLSGDKDDLDGLMKQQAWQAINEADLVLFLVDGREGLVASDEAVAEALRKTGKPAMLIVNKTDGIDPEIAMADFYQLGLSEPWPIAASHGRGVDRLMKAAADLLPDEADQVEDAASSGGIRVAVVGRPNVGKSTLINRMLGEDRVLAFDQPGTTREEVIEKFSVIKTLQAIDAANVVILVLDGQKEVSDQDATLAGYILEKGRALVVAVNKWDGLSNEQRQIVKNQFELKLPFLGFAKTLFISALHGTAVGELFPYIQKAYDSAMLEVPTPELNKLLERALEAHQPPLKNGRRIKLRYAHQGGRNPPIIVIHGSQAGHVPDVYKRYLVNFFRNKLKLSGTPVRVEFRTGDNPFKGRRNKLTDRQIKRKRRLMRHVKR